MDVLLYGEGLQKRKKKRNAARTAADKFLTVHSFLKSLGIKVVTGRDAPKYVEEMPDVYAQEELDAFFAACDPTRVVDLLGIPQSWAARKKPYASGMVLI